jgi:hypothetical protein
VLWELLAQCPTLAALCCGSCSRNARRSQLCVRRQPPRQLLRAGRLEAYEPQDLDACFVKLLAKGDLVIGHRGLIKQRDVFEERVHAALDDLGNGLFGLALLLRRGLCDAALVRDQFRRNVITAEVLRTHRCYLHCGAASYRLIRSLVLDQHPHLRGEVRRSAMQIAAMRPRYISRDEVPAELVENERRIAEAAAKEEGKPEQAVPKIVEGRVNAYFKDVALLDQPSVTDNKVSFGKQLDEAGIKVLRFVRFEAAGAQ